MDGAEDVLPEVQCSCFQTSGILLNLGREQNFEWQIKKLFLNCRRIELACVLKTAHFLKTSVKKIPLIALHLMVCSNIIF